MAIVFRVLGLGIMQVIFVRLPLPQPPIVSDIMYNYLDFFSFLGYRDNIINLILIYLYTGDGGGV